MFWTNEISRDLGLKWVSAGHPILQQLSDIMNDIRSISYCINISLQWRHNERNGISKHQPRDCLHSRLIRPRSKKTPRLCVTGLCAGDSPVTGEFPAQMASNAENVSIWWRHHVCTMQVQWEQNGGKCGVCGDRYDGPRDHEIGGKYATGVVVAEYQPGDIIPVTVELTGETIICIEYFHSLAPGGFEQNLRSHFQTI